MIKSIAIKDLTEIKMAALRLRYPSMPEHAIPRPKYSDLKSNGLTKCIIDWINLYGYQAERVNSMGRMIDKSKVVTDVLGWKRTIGSKTWIPGTGTNGTADISATIKGRSIKIEVKCKATGDNKQSDGQVSYQEQVEGAGGVYVIARTFDGFVDWYVKFLAT